MAVNPIISKDLGDNCVQVDVNSNKARTRYYKVSKDTADEFCTSYKKRDKRDNIISNTAFILSALLGCSGMNFLVRNIKSGATRMLLGALGGVLTAFGVDFALRKVMVPKHENFVQSFGAEEFYEEEDNSPKVADIIK